MSKLTARVIFSVLISLGIVFAIYTSVQGASANRSESKAGSHLVSGAMVNLNHDRYTVAELQAYKAQLESSYGAPDSSKGPGCQSDVQNSPDD
jgi:hypothetical protein